MKVLHFQALVVGALCLGAAVLAAETYNHHQQLAELQAAARNAPADPTPALRRDIDALADKLTTLQPQVVALGEAQSRHTTAQVALGQQQDELAASLKTLQAAPPGSSSTDMTALEQRLAAAEATLERLSARPSVSAAASTQPQASIGEKAKAKALTPPFTLLGIETRGDVRFVAALPVGAHSLTTVHLLQPGDSFNSWQLRAIRADQVVFHIPGHGDRTLPLP
ncbi:hypothetical protein I5S62_03595 [Pseudomonas putida]|uniref:BEACH domain-containing protein n=1 Tax=Pseudomonas putida TaxID=303 RepID=A0A2S3XCX0_PSEPU|nr:MULTISPECIES: hypothetical protein [Pseudomonas]PTC01482.1 hypothetical protein C9975_01900 [Thalassospira xiamenensis]AVD83848.1 hypothetical protein C4Q28_17545 [Pseudomonas sp. SWI6]AVD94983.1 hypothetical protein C4Q27_22570 [Pseudomonas sp. SWI36]ELU0814780.1 hypothetical protein [Pseudomonas putida]MBH3388205.1 hypothetical protein [Pseudomonas putida]